MENTIRKDMYNASPIDLRTYINGETAIKPYYYLRNGLLHVRYTVDRCIELSPSEIAHVKVKMTDNPEKKQDILADEWHLQTVCIGKSICNDGIHEAEKRMGSKGYGRKD